MFFARIVYAKARTRALQRTAPGRLRVSRLLLPADPPRSNRATLRRPSAVSELESLAVPSRPSLLLQPAMEAEVVEEELFGEPVHPGFSGISSPSRHGRGRAAGKAARVCAG